MKKSVQVSLSATLLLLAALLSGCFSGELPLTALLAGTPTATSSLPPATQPTSAPSAAAPSGLKPYGRILFVRDGHIAMWRDGVAQAVTDGLSATQPSWAPDGNRIVYVVPAEVSSDLFTFQLDAEKPEQLTSYRTSRSRVWAFKPAWSPDGKLISYLTDASSSDLALWTINAVGGGQRPLVSTDWRGGIDGYSWSPDGKQLAIAGFRSDQEQIFLYTPSSGQWRPLTNVKDGAYDPRFSPDGRRIAFVARDAGRHDIWTMDLNGGDQMRLTDEGTCRSPAWSPNGEYVAFLSVRGGQFEVSMTFSAPLSGRSRGASSLPLMPGQSVDSRGGLAWAE